MDQRSDSAKHCDADALALIALGEATLDVRVASHLEHCDRCQRELADLRSTITVARSAVGETGLIEPPSHVWQAIRGELALSPTLQPPTLQAPAQPTRARSGESPLNTPAPVVELASRRTRRASIRRTIGTVVASAAAAALITGAILGWGAAQPRPADRVVAAASLEALPAWPSATGEATVAERPDGQRVLRVALEQDVDGDVAREVWLLTPEVDGLISLGYLSGSSGEFEVPDSVDLSRYSVVDISAEPLDGDPTHSGDSIVRGALDV